MHVRHQGKSAYPHQETPRLPQHEYGFSFNPPTPRFGIGMGVAITGTLRIVQHSTVKGKRASHSVGPVYLIQGAGDSNLKKSATRLFTEITTISSFPPPGILSIILKGHVIASACAWTFFRRGLVFRVVSSMLQYSTPPLKPGRNT